MNTSRRPDPRPSNTVAAAAVITLLSVGAAFAQATRPARQASPPPLSSAPQTSTALLPDLVAEYSAVTIVESSGEAECTPHNHTATSQLRLGGRFGPSFPNPTAVLYKDGQLLATWAAPPAPTGTLVILGTFTWTIHHDCSGGITVTQAPPKNYRLVLDPNGRLTEASEANNVLEFYVSPSAGWSQKH